MTEQERAVETASRAATRECQRIGYNPLYTIQLVARVGALKAARQILGGSPDATGFTELFLRSRLGLSVEAIAIRPEFRELFTDEMLAEARRRLVEVNYQLPDNPD